MVGKMCSNTVSGGPGKTESLPTLLVFTSGSVLVHRGIIPVSPLKNITGKLKLTEKGELKITRNGHTCRAVWVEEPETVADEEWSFLNLRVLAFTTPGEIFSLVSKAYHLLHWDQTHRFCSRCTEPLAPGNDGYSKKCPACGLHLFPQIAPAIIIAVTRGSRLLMAHNVMFPEGLYSLVAGFVEPGETIEECAVREVKEETGIDIRNVRYYGSQPWPFPNSLMIGLTAEYDGGEIHPDGVEISDAHWFSADELPPHAGKGLDIPGTDRLVY